MAAGIAGAPAERAAADGADLGPTLATGTGGSPTDLSLSAASTTLGRTDSLSDWLDGEIARSAALTSRPTLADESVSSDRDQQVSPAAPVAPQPAPSVAPARTAAPQPVRVAAPAPPAAPTAAPATCPATWFCYPRLGIAGPIVPYTDCSGGTDVGTGIRSYSCLSDNYLMGHAYTQFGLVRQWVAGDTVFAWGKRFTVTGAVTEQSCAAPSFPLATLSMQTSLTSSACGAVLVVQAR